MCGERSCVAGGELLGAWVSGVKGEESDGGGGGGGGGRSGMQSQRQKPYTMMWGTNLNPKNRQQILT